MASVAMANGINAKLLRRWVLTASAVSRREVQIAATSTPGTALHASIWFKPQFAPITPTRSGLTVISRSSSTV
jgi:hypothetical protein